MSINGSNIGLFKLPVNIKTVKPTEAEVAEVVASQTSSTATVKTPSVNNTELNTLQAEINQANIIKVAVTGATTPVKYINSKVLDLPKDKTEVSTKDQYLYTSYSELKSILEFQQQTFTSAEAQEEIAAKLVAVNKQLAELKAAKLELTNPTTPTNPNTTPSDSTKSANKVEKTYLCNLYETELNNINVMINRKPGATELAKLNARAAELAELIAGETPEVTPKTEAEMVSKIVDYSAQKEALETKLEQLHASIPIGKEYTSEERAKISELNTQITNVDMKKARVESLLVVEKAVQLRVAEYTANLVSLEGEVHKLYITNPNGSFSAEEKAQLVTLNAQIKEIQAKIVAAPEVVAAEMKISEGAVTPAQIKAAELAAKDAATSATGHAVTAKTKGDASIESSFEAETQAQIAKAAVAEIEAAVSKGASIAEITKIVEKAANAAKAAGAAAGSSSAAAVDAVEAAANAKEAAKSAGAQSAIAGTDVAKTSFAKATEESGVASAVAIAAAQKSSAADSSAIDAAIAAATVAAAAKAAGVVLKSSNSQIENPEEKAALIVKAKAAVGEVIKAASVSSISSAAGNEKIGQNRLELMLAALA